MHKRAVGIIATIGTLALISGCAGGPAETPPASTTARIDTSDWGAVVSAAKQEGHVQVWSAIQGTLNDELKAAFEREYPGIEVTVTPFTPTDIVQKVDAEHATGQASADFIIQTDRGWHAKVAAQGYFTAISGPDTVAADQLLRNGAPVLTDGRTVASQALYENDTLAVINYSGLGYSWNTEAVSNQPDFKSLFADDTYKGRIGIVAPDSSLGIQNAYAVWVDRYPTIFERIGQLDPSVYPTGIALAQAMAAGAVDVGFPSTVPVAAQMKNLGFAYDLPAPAQPRFGEIMAAAANPHAAQVFANWLLTPDAQALFVKKAGALPVIPVEGALASDDVVVYDVAASAKLSATIDEINAALNR
jgi:iron(III) transport system substrate-binding protein